MRGSADAGASSRAAEPSCAADAACTARRIAARCVRAQYDGVRQGYESGLARNPTLGGRITLRFAIELDGTTSRVAVCNNELADCAAVECMRAAFGAICECGPLLVAQFHRLGQDPVHICDQL
jgi:hypothetical protein